LLVVWLAASRWQQAGLGLGRTWRIAVEPIMTHDSSLASVVPIRESLLIIGAEAIKAGIPLLKVGVGSSALTHIETVKLETWSIIDCGGADREAEAIRMNARIYGNHARQ
jgi:hypothetical protein